MFIGEYHHALDGKGRLAVPVKFRAALKEGAVVTRGLDSCLFVYTMAEWQKVVQKISSLPSSQANTRAYQRLMLAGAMDVEIDAQGRALIPEYLRRYAKLGRDVVVAGLYGRLEIWDRASWEKYRKRTEKDANDIAEKMGELGV